MLCALSCIDHEFGLQLSKLGRTLPALRKLARDYVNDGIDAVIFG